ncbi:MAG: DUF882 domain-containing protein [Candidatus Omnitrophica bacterium]|nr:DUF882 domain-containing protein [Candidatus Omnitrophota bacterium]
MRLILSVILSLIVLALITSNDCFAQQNSLQKIDNGIKLSEHFAQRELACSCCGETRVNFMLIIKLEELRERLNAPIIITSGYRCPLHNKAVGGVKNSQHLYGNAVDIKVEGYSPTEVSEIAKEMGFTFTKVYSTWVHVDIR